MVYADGATYTLKLYTIAPTHHEAVGCVASAMSQKEIGVCLETKLKLMPDYVSFENLMVMEEVCAPTGITGVFSSSDVGLLSHDISTGALKEVDVHTGNLTEGDFAGASFTMKPPWCAGSFQYNIPECWRLKKEDSPWHLFHIESQINTFSTDGVYRITKYGVTAARKEYGEPTIERGVKNE